MDLVLNFLDQYLFTPYVYPGTWTENDLLRQVGSLFLVTNIAVLILYFCLASFSFVFVFDRTLMQHPLILENQIQKEIMVTLKSIPFISFPTALLFVLQVRGYSRLYPPSNFAWPHLLGDIFFSTISFLLFTDSLFYWIHRGFHHRSVYKYLHKVHHRWKVPTPFASHAFHPVEGFFHSLPYHLFPFLFPLNKHVYLGLFVFVNIWTVSIHDGDFRVPDLLRPFISGSAHHADHHLLNNCNYGQFFTLWDRIGGSFRHPSAFQGKAPIDDLKKNGGKMG